MQHLHTHFQAPHPCPHSRKAEHPAWKGNSSHVPAENKAAEPQRVPGAHCRGICKVHCPTQMPIPDSELFTFDMVPLLTGTTEFPWGPLACNSGKLQIKALPRNRRAKCSWGVHLEKVTSASWGADKQGGGRREELPAALSRICWIGGHPRLKQSPWRIPVNRLLKDAEAP